MGRWRLLGCPMQPTHQLQGERGGQGPPDVALELASYADRGIDDIAGYQVEWSDLKPIACGGSWRREGAMVVNEYQFGE